jgi:hypothetical protein
MSRTIVEEARLRPAAVAADIYGTATERLIGQLWDACGAFVEHRRAIVRRRGLHGEIEAAMPASEGDKPDAQLARAMAADLTMPRFLYVNERQWEDQPPELVNFVYLMGLEVRTSRHIPPNSAHLTRDEFPADEVGKAIAAEQKLPVFA